MGVEQECEWKKGSSWRLMVPDGRVADVGKILEITKGKRFVIAWKNQFIPKAQKEGISRMTLTLQQKGAATHLVILHEMNEANSFFIECIAHGWPIIMSSFKSLLEKRASLLRKRASGQKTGSRRFFSRLCNSRYCFCFRQK